MTLPLNRLAVGACALALTLGGCGSDDESADTTTSAPPTATETEAEPAPTASAPEAVTETEVEPAETETEAPRPEPSPSPEDQPGGAGDEEPARSLALFTGREGRITPRVVRVPAFISIRVELRSADGGEYGLEFEGETIRVRGGLGSVSTTLDGLRPGAAVAGEPVGADGRVRIEATAEPGP